MSAKTHTTAVVLMPPESLWPAIQVIRQQRDRNVRRWMPHITLLYPFAPRTTFPTVAPLLAAACRRVPLFTITLARFEYFTHGPRGATIYLVPEPAAPLVALQTQLWQALPVYGDTRRYAQGFMPHLSVGQAHGATEARELCETLVAIWQPISFTVEAVQLLWRAEPPDDVFRVAQTLGLGQS